MWFLNIKFMKIVEIGLTWVHMARYEFILRLDGALRLRIISKPLLTPQRAMEGPKDPKKYKTSNLTFRQVNFVAGLGPRTENQGSTPSAAEGLMPRDMSSEPRHWMVLGQLVMAAQCCAEAWRRRCLSTALHSHDQLAKYHPSPWLR